MFISENQAAKILPTLELDIFPVYLMIVTLPHIVVKGSYMKKDIRALLARADRG